MQAPELKLLDKLIDNESPHSVLSALADYITSITKADGIKIFLVNKEKNNQAVLRRIYSSTTNAPYFRPLFDINDEKGLAEWCMINNQWLSVQNCEATAGNEEICVAGPNKTRIIRKSIPEKESCENNEKSLVVFPLYGKKCNPLYGDKRRPIGVFSIWSSQQSFFSFDNISEWLVNCANIIAKASSKYIYLKHKLEEEKLQFELPQLFMPVKSTPHPLKNIPQIYRAFLTKLKRLIPVSHIVMFEQDYDLSHIIKSIAQAANNNHSIYQYFATFHIEGDKNHKAWDKLAQTINQQQELDGLVYEGYLIQPDSKGGANIGLAIIDYRGLAIEEKCMFFHASQFQSLQKLLKRLNDNLAIYLESFVRQWIKQLNEDVYRRKEVNPSWLLDKTVTIIHEATKATAIVYDRDFNSQVVASCPKSPQIHGSFVKPQSLTAKAIREKRAYSIFDVRKDFKGHKALFEPQLNELMQGLGWNYIHSWQVAPIACYSDDTDTAVLGIYKIVTRDSYLSSAHMSFIKAIAEWAFYHYRQFQKNNTLIALNKMSNEIAHNTGETLTQAAIKKVTEWLGTCIRTGCKFLFVCKMRNGIILNLGCSEALSNHKHEFIEQLTAQVVDNANEEANAFLRTLKSMLSLSQKNAGGEHFRFNVTGDEDFNGQLYVLSEEPFSRLQVQLLRELTQELSIIFYQEKLKHQWRAETGIFRHSIISPVQGLVGVAEQLLKHSAKFNTLDSESIRKYRARSKRYQAQVRNWRAYQRLEVDGQIALDPTVQELKPLLKEWISRAKDEAARKRKTLKFMSPKGSIEFLFEVQALDIAFNNLLDNAIKYSPDYEEIIISAYIQHNRICIAVKNVGSKIPETIQKRLFDFGQRNINTKNKKVIPGQGIGLTLSKSLIEAHDGGQLYFDIITNENPRLGNGEDASIIRFIISLPHHWRRQ